jgi:UDP-glucose 4-epimerase
MRILITGGNGFVGRALVRALYAEHEVTVVDNLRSGRDRFSDDERGRFRLFEHDVRDTTQLRLAWKATRPDIVVHLAAIHYIPECEAFPAEAVSVNEAGTVSVLHCCGEGTRFVFASSAAVYGAEESPHREAESLLAPMDVYGLSKLHGENYVRRFTQERALGSTIVRLFNVVGPGETNPHVVPTILAQIVAGNRELSLGNLASKRDYICVYDAAAAFATIALTRQTAGACDCVNVGTGNAYSVQQLVDEFGAVSGETLSATCDPGKLRVCDRPYACASIEEVRRVYQWSPVWDLRRTLRQTWRARDFPPACLAPPCAPGADEEAGIAN